MDFTSPARRMETPHILPSKPTPAYVVPYVSDQHLTSRAHPTAHILKPIPTNIHDSEMHSPLESRQSVSPLGDDLTLLPRAT